MMQAPTEVAEADAQGKVKEIYADIKATLRLPFVSQIFRLLGSHPDYLVLAWRALKPNAQTVYFEDRANELLRRALSGTTPQSGQTAAPELQNAVRALLYVTPKMCLAIATLHSATNGSQPKLMEITREAKRQIAPGVPPELAEFGASTVPQNDSSLVDQSELDAQPNVPTPTDDYNRILGGHLDQLQPVLREREAISDSPEVRTVLRDIFRNAEQAISSMPFRMNLSPHVLRHGGLTEADIDSVRAILSSQYLQARESLANTAFVAARTLGTVASSEILFPPTVL